MNDRLLSDPGFRLASVADARLRGLELSLPLDALRAGKPTMRRCAMALFGPSAALDPMALTPL
ncbi:hypothetical protein ASF53_09840 [Methylobacterium sp. Leaf123]|nr:hypothetical protein ASF53_09840 [Methylobacterium sp. Leaf123]